jgi:hypothetical protein
MCAVQIAARHVGPRSTMRYDKARQNLGRRPNYILAAFMASAPDPACVSRIPTLAGDAPHCRIAGVVGEARRRR